MMQQARVYKTVNKMRGGFCSAAGCRIYLTVEEVRAYLQLGFVQAVYKYEAGRSYPPTDAMFALMQLYQADLYDILCDCEKRPALESVRITQVQRSRRVNKFWEVYKDYLYNNAG